MLLKFCCELKKENKMTNNVICALVTPFYNGKIDFLSLKRLLRLQQESKQLLVLGSTGENLSLSLNEKQDVLKCVKDNYNGEIIVGVESPSTNQAILECETFEKYSPFCFLVTTPYFFMPETDGVIEHFSAVAKNHKIILYNVPSRTKVDMPLKATQILAKKRNVIGIKDASKNLERANILSQERNFSVFCGNEEICSCYRLVGARGVFSVVANLMPSLVQDSFLLKQKATFYLSNLCSRLFAQPNPLGVKYLLKKQNLISSCECRLPLTSFSQSNCKKLDACLKNMERESL